MKKTILLLFLPILLLSSNFLNAQVADSTNKPKVIKKKIIVKEGSVEDKYREQKVEEIKKEKKKKIKIHKESLPKYLIKTSPFSLVRGEIPLHFEKSFAKKFSFEISPIITTRDYAGFDWQDNSNFNNPFAYKTNFKYENLTYDASLGIRGEIRFYPNDAFDGIYIGIGATKKKYMVHADLTAISPQNQDFSYFSSDKRIVFGGVHNLKDSEIFYIDWYFGIGTRKYYAEKYPVYSDSKINYQKLSDKRFGFYANLKFGFKF